MTAPHPAAGQVVTVTDVTYPIRVLQADTPVLLAFMAYQDQLCQTLRPILADIAHDYGDRMTVATLDVASNPATVHVWGVRQIPVMVVLHHGVTQRVLLGIRPRARLARELDEVLQQLPHPAP